jgi:hypothetical protein
MFYRWRFERALRALSVDPYAVPRHHQRAAMSNGQDSGDTPQEAAIILISMLPRQRQRRPRSDLMTDWVVRGKLDIKKHHIREALDLVGHNNFRG